MVQGIRYAFMVRLLILAAMAGVLMLSACTRDSVSANDIIDAEGGKLFSDDGVFGVEIPRGALTQPVRFAVDTEDPLVSPQLSPTWRVTPGIQLDADYRATVFMRLSGYADSGVDPVADVVPVLVQGANYVPLSPVELLSDNSVVRVKSEYLTGFALFDWGCTKLCRKTSLCETGAEPTESELDACAQQCHTDLNDWRQNWCRISAACEDMLCCTNPDAPQCNGDGDQDDDISDGDTEPDTDPDTEEAEESPESDEEMDAEAEQEPEAEEEADVEPDAERSWPEPKRCFSSEQCGGDETCFVPANLCFEIPDVNATRYVRVDGNLISVSGDPDISCNDKPFVPTEGPTNTRVTVRVTMLGFDSSLQGITVAVYRQMDWFNDPTMTPLLTGVTDELGQVRIDLVPTNEKLVFRTLRDDDDVNARIVGGNNVDILIPAADAQQAPPATGVLIDVFAANRRTYEGYPQIAGYNGIIPADGGIIWTVLKDCQGYFINNAVGEMWEMQAPAHMYLTRNLQPQTSFNHTDAAGHTLFFDIPYGQWEIRFIGRTDRNDGEPEFLVKWDEQPTIEPPVLGHIIPAIPGEIVFCELNRWGWELPDDN